MKAEKEIPLWSYTGYLVLANTNTLAEVDRAGSGTSQAGWLFPKVTCQNFLLPIPNMKYNNDLFDLGKKYLPAGLVHTIYDKYQPSDSQSSLAHVSLCSHVSGMVGGPNHDPYLAAVFTFIYI